MISWQQQYDEIRTELVELEQLLGDPSKITILSGSDLLFVYNRLAATRELVEKFLRDRSPAKGENPNVGNQNSKT